MSLIALMMEAVNIFETSVYFYKTISRNIPKGCHLYTRRRESLKYHSFNAIWLCIQWDLVSCIWLVLYRPVLKVKKVPVCLNTTPWRNIGYAVVTFRLPSVCSLKRETWCKHRRVHGHHLIPCYAGCYKRLDPRIMWITLRRLHIYLFAVYLLVVHLTTFSAAQII
jgi:hypothetical protein